MVCLMKCDEFHTRRQDTTRTEFNAYYQGFKTITVLDKLLDE